MKRTKQKSNHLIRMVALLAMLLVGVNASWAQIPTTRKDLGSLGSDAFALVNANDGGKILYGTDAQNAGYNFYSAIGSTYTGYTFVLEKPSGSYEANDYLLKFRTPSNGDYNIWGKGVAYLNANSSNVVFVLGNNDHNNGTDVDDGAVWNIIDNGDGTYKLKNKAFNKFLVNGATIGEETNAAKWSFCTLGTGCKVDYKSNQPSWGTVTGKRLDTNEDVNTGVVVSYGTKLELTAHPNSGYVFKNWSNGETGLTRVLTVTGNGDPSGTFEAGCIINFGVVDRYNNAAADLGTVTATVNGNPITSGTAVASGTTVRFSVTANDSKYLSWGWYENGARGYDAATVDRTVTANLTMNAVLNQGVTFNAYPNNGSLGNVRVWLDETEKGTTFTTNPGTTTITFRATPIGDATFDGWYDSSYLTNRVSTETTYTVPDTNHGLDLWAKFTAPAFDPSLALNGTAGGNVVSYENGVLTVKGGSNNVIRVKDNVTGHANDYTGIRLTTEGKACRLIVRWGPDDNTERSIKVIDEANKPTTSYYSWSMLGVPQGKVSSISDIYFAGAQDYSYSESNTGVTTFSDASLVNVTETTPYTREIGEVREFNLNDTRVELYGHGDHYQMGGNIQWVYRSETNGLKYATMKTTKNSYNQMEIFNSGHSIASYDGIHIDYKGQHFRVVAYKGEDKFVYTVPASTDKMTARFVTWKDLGIEDPTGLTRIEVAGCSEHDNDGEESVNFYGIRLYKSLKDVIYTDESVTAGTYNGNLTYTENHDGNNMSVVFKAITGEDRADDCQGTVVRKGTDHGFTINAPACYKITKIRVGLGENSTSKVLFNNNTVNVNNQNQIEWTNNDVTSSVTMTIPSDAANVLHVKYVYYELEEIAIPTVNVNGQTRQYVVYAPDGIASSESSKVGVVISLHGASNDYWNGRVDFDAIANNEKNTNKKFVVVYPRGLMRQLRGTERGWESYTENNTEDVDFFKAIVEELKKTYSVDMNRIYLAGFSNGGMMAYKAAHQAGDFFAAFASVGGFPVNESHLFHAGSQPTPFIHIQGAADGVFPKATYDISTIAHNMTYRNGAHFNPYDEGHNSDGGVVPAHSNVTKEIHVADEGGAAYFLYTIKDMGHTWTYDWDGNTGDDVAQSIWNFFNYDDKISRKGDGTSNVDKTLKFRISDPGELWTIAKTGKSTQDVEVGYIGFDNVDTGTSVLSYGGRTKTGSGNGTYNRDSNNNNIWHSLQFKGVVGGTPHYLKLNITTSDAGSSDYFIIKLTKTGETTPVVLRRYQATNGSSDYVINFDALNGWNEYKLTVEKNVERLGVQVNGIESHSGSAKENAAFFPADLNTVLSGMNPIYQPIYGLSYDGIAKEYLPIADIPVPTKDTPKATKTIEDILEVTKKKQDSEEMETVYPASIPSSITSGTNGSFINLAVSGKETNEQKAFKSKNAYILGTGYTMDSNKGIALSSKGPAGMPAYVAGSGNFPTKGVIAMKVQGTFDIAFLLYNQSSDVYGEDNRKLKVYYTNDQLNGELKEWKDWDFYGTRNETNDNGRNVLDVAVRMPQLGQNGTCTIFLTYEGAVTDANVWVKGCVIHRPNLDVTIGRTDKLRYHDVKDKDGEGNELETSTSKPINEKNDRLTPFGENKPYQWNFGTAAFSAINPETGAEAKKVNQFDGRTYIGGLGPNGEELKDHLLVYSDGAGDDKASFDGRPSNGRHKGYEDDLTDNNEHIEFTHPTKYSGINTQNTHQDGFDVNRRSFNPILSNGLKVNVTGSGWFTIACSAPNGPVNMKVLSSTNGGLTYINLLREFVVSNEEDVDKNEPGYNKETSWHTYRVYLKAHKEVGYRDSNRNITDASHGFWDGNEDLGEDLDPEDTQMSLYIVFDKLTEYKGEHVAYDDGNNETSNDDAQLNIHYLQWINEMPADYVFQREENPELLNTRQSIKSNGTDAKPGLYWQAGTSMTEDKYSKTPKSETYAKSAYNSAGQDATEGGQSSGWGKVSTDLGCAWNVAAKAHTIAHTEVDYANGNVDYAGFSNAYNYNVANSTSAENSRKNLEFAIPMSGSFLRFMPMKNQFISAWIVPEEKKTTKIFVLDETGKPIPFIAGADMQDGNKSKVTQEAREHGWVHAASGATHNPSDNSFSADGTTSLRIDFAALASKEYFIVSNEGTISLARLQATNNAYRAAVEEINNAVTLTDNADNSDIISNAMSGTVVATDEGGNDVYARYVSDADGRGITLTRKFEKGKWASLVLPFSLNEKKFEEIFGEGAQCLHFTDVDKTTNTVKFTRHYYNMVVAGRPIFVRPMQANVVNPVFKDVTLSAKTVTNTTTPGGFEFVATYDNAAMKKNDLYINKNNEVKYLTSQSGTYAGMRSFIRNNAGFDFASGISTSGTEAKAMFFNFFDLEPEYATGIEELITSEFGENAVIVTKSTKVYDLKGRVVVAGADINNLPAGIYIVNGKKFIVK